MPGVQTCLPDSRLCNFKIAAVMKGEVNELMRRCRAVGTLSCGALIEVAMRCSVWWSLKAAGPCSGSA